MGLCTFPLTWNTGMFDQKKKLICFSLSSLCAAGHEPPHATSRGPLMAGLLARRCRLHIAWPPGVVLGSHRVGVLMPSSASPVTARRRGAPSRGAARGPRRRFICFSIVKHCRSFLGFILLPSFCLEIFLCLPGLIYSECELGGL